MKIKIKIKTLILLIFLIGLTFIWGIPTATLSIAYLLEDRSDMATLFYEKYAAYPTTSNIKGGFLYADSLINGFSKFTIFLTGWGGGADTSPEDIVKAKKILEDIMKEIPDNNSEKEYYIESYKMLLDIAIATGDVETLQMWISYGQKNRDEKITYTADIYNGFFLHVHGDSEEVKKIIDKYDNTELADKKLDILKAEVALFEGNYQDSKSIYEKMDNNYWVITERNNFGSLGYYERNFWFDRVMDDFKGDNIIRGTVTFEGKPMPFVEIYVQAADGGFSSGGEGYIGITDENGEFETLGLKDGLYNIGIGVDGSLLANKVLQRSNHKYVDLNGKDEEIDFIFKNTLNISSPEPGHKLIGNEFTVSWDKVEGAAYYTVEPVVFFEPYNKSSGSYRSYALDKFGERKFTSTKATFNIEMLSKQPGSLTFGEEMILEPSAILGIFLPGVEYPIVVNAFDENNKLITSSLPLRSYYDQMPSVIVEGELSEGEEMILSKDYPAAIEYYENILKGNPNDIDSLIYLTRIYGMGWKQGERNIEKASVLAQRYSNITGDKKLLLNCLHLLEKDELKENSEIVLQAFKEANQVLDDSDYYFLSKYYIAFEKYDEAREALKNTESVTDNLIYLNMYFEDYQEAAENVMSKNYHLSRLSSSKIVETLKELDENPPQANDKQIFNEFLLKLINGINHEKGYEIYEEAVSQISNNNFKIILNEICLERHWGRY